MMTKMKTVGIALLSVMTITAQTQTTSIKETRAPVAHHKQSKTVPEPPIEAQLREMRVELQSEIDDLKTSLAAKDVQIAALQAKMQTAQEGAGTTAVQVHSIDNNVQENVAAVTMLQTSVSTTQRVASTQGLEIAAIRKAEESVRKDVEEPRTIRYRGIEITPGGFIAGESIWRQRAMNADLHELQLDALHEHRRSAH